MGILVREDVIAKVEMAVRILKKGEMIILTDHVDRENEGDLVCLAQHIRPDQVEFMTRKGRGLICASLGGEIRSRLGLQKVANNNSPMDTPFTESLDAQEGVSTGISAKERAITLRTLADPKAQRSDFSFPGHIFPLAAHSRGLFARQGHTEASIELARLAGSEEAAVICEILGEQYGMARGRELEDFARDENLFVLSIEELLIYLYRAEGETYLPLPQGDFTISTFPILAEENMPTMLIRSRVEAPEMVPVRIHSQCATGDIFGSRRCDCGEQLQRALEIIGHQGGAIIYLPQEGRGIGLANKLKAYELQDQGMDTLEANLALGRRADERNYHTAVLILRSENIRAVELLSNNPEKMEALEEAGFLVQRKSLEIEPGEHNEKYMQTKAEKMGHLLSLKIKKY